jgi:predicted dehydrogenase
MYTSAIIGAGRWGKKLIKELDRFDILKTVVFSGKAETELWLRENCPEISATNNLNHILNDEKIVNIFIATPINTHSKLAIACLEAGKNVFVEKPLSTNIAEVTYIHQLAQRKGLKLVTGYVYLFDPSLARLKELVLNLGEIRYFRRASY